ncbi:MAG: family 16 glycosylhydrolase [Chitinophagales bacterium]|nr:family 16 glycosylhydrolase [Chitinophagales bacterium]
MKRCLLTGFAVLLCGLTMAQQLGEVYTTIYQPMGVPVKVNTGLVAQDSGIVIGGAFERVHERAINRLAKLKQDGTNDYSFDIGSGFNGEVNVVVEQPNGRLIVGGDFTQYNGSSCNRIVRLMSDGSRDTSFSIGTGFNGSVYDIELLAGGELVVVGTFTTYNGSTRQRVAKLNSNGSLYSSFSVSVNNTIFCIARDTSGRLVIGGSFTTVSGVSCTRIARLKSSGVLDTAYSTATSGANNTVNEVALQPGGEAIFAGYFTQFNGSTVNRIVRLSSTGTVDGTYSSGSGFGGAQVNEMVWQSDGKLLVIGHFTSYDGTTLGRVVRLDSNGTRDTTFTAGTGLDYSSNAIWLNYDGSVFVGGTFTTVNGFGRLGLAKLSSSGSLDKGFMKNSGADGPVLAFGTQSSGKTIVAGDFVRYNGDTVNRIMRLNRDGSLDSGFGSGTGANGVINAVLVQPDDKIVIAGSFTTYNGVSKNRIARLHSDGSIDSTYQSGSGANAAINEAKWASSGKLYIAGSFTSYNGTTRNRVCRLNSNGSLDAGFNAGTTFSAAVHDIVEQPDGKVIGGGGTVSGGCGGTPCSLLRRVDSTGAADNTFDAGTTTSSTTIQALQLQPDGKLLVNCYTSFNGIAASRMARLNTNGSVDTVFAGGANFHVQEFLKVDSMYLVAGAFTQVNSTSKMYLGSIKTNGQTDATFYTGDGMGYVYYIAGYCKRLYADEVNGRIWAGGVFSTAQGGVNNNMAVFRGTYGSAAAIDSVKMPSVVCPGSSLYARFKNTRYFNEGNVFTAELSDSSGSFASAKVIGHKTATGAPGWDSLWVSIADTVLPGSHYRIRIKTSNAIYVSAASGEFAVGALPAAPPALAAKSACSDTAYTFVWDSVLVGSGGDSIEWADNAAFASSHLTPSPSPVGEGGIYLTVNVGETDTVWLRSRNSVTGCVSGRVYVTGRVNLKPERVTPPAPQSVVSDTGYYFNYDSIYAGFGGGELIWSLQENFASADTLNSPATFGFAVATDTFAMLWLQSRDTGNGCVSEVSSTIALVHTVENIPQIKDTMIGVCAGFAGEVPIYGTVVGNKYYLLEDTTIVNSGWGNGGTLVLGTGAIDSVTTMRVFMQDTSSGDMVTLDICYALVPVQFVDTVEFTQYDSLFFTGDTVCYSAIGNNADRIVYNIVSGTAQLDSLSGCVSSATTDFVIRATAHGATGCGYVQRDLSVKVTDIGIPVAPDEIVVIADTIGELTLMIDSIFAGVNGDEVEWSFYANFDTTFISTSPVNVTLALPSGADTVLYLRSKNSSTRKASKPIKIPIRTPYFMLSASLIDKSRWVYDAAKSDEFDYDKIMPSDVGAKFSDKWALNYGWAGGSDPLSAKHCGNHNIWSQYCQTQFHNMGNTDYPGIGNGVDGSAGEVTFNNGVVYVKATKLSPNPVSLSCGTCIDSNGPASDEQCQNYTVGASSDPCSLKRFDYKSGLLYSRNKFDFSHSGIYEIRCKLPTEKGSWPTFWFFENNGSPNYHTTEIDVIDRAGWSSSNEDPVLFHQKFPINVIDYNYNGQGSRGCQGMIYKQTPCDYTQDWHTFTMVYTVGNDITFFVDGKEVWGKKITYNGATFPSAIANWQADLIISLQTWGGEYDEAVFEVDYFRHYTPDDGNIGGDIYMQNRLSGAPKTPETPALSLFSNGIFAAGSNNKAVYFEILKSNSHDIGGTRMGITGTGSNVRIFYRGYGTDKRGYMAFIDDGSWGYAGKWIERPLPVNLFGGDVKDWMTPVNANLVYFQNHYNHLSYFKNNNGTWSKSKALYNKPISNQPAIISNCDGYITITDNGQRIWYKGTDHNLFCWHPGSNWLEQVTYDGSVRGGLVMANCGCLVFYRDAQNKLRQLYWAGSWHSMVPVVNQNIVTDEVALDETNARVFFIGSDHAVYYYSYDYSSPKPYGLFKLGNSRVSYADKTKETSNDINNETRCSDYYNAQSNLTLNSDRNMVYYKGLDGNLWYYFNDKEHSFVTDLSTSKVTLVSKANWHKTPLAYDHKIAGHIAIEHGSFGRLFYTKSNHKLYKVDWVNAHYVTECNVSGPETHNNINTFKTDETEDIQLITADTLTDFVLQVWPNPSDGSFNFSAERVQGGTLNITDASGRLQYNERSENGRWVWQAANVNAGVYYYQLVANDKQHTGKLVKY